jgi:hypothetical protein
MSSTKQHGDNPGYPHYPAKEDITHAGNNTGKEALDENNLSVANAYDLPGQEHVKPLHHSTAPVPDSEERDRAEGIDDSDEDVHIVMGTDADVTAEDLRLLQESAQNMNTTDSGNLLGSALDDVDFDGDPLSEDSIDTDMTGEDLDVPGSEEDDADELIGEEDEENNYYSLGGDNHEGQEEDQGD